MKHIGIIVATEEEYEAIKEIIEDIQISNIYNIEFIKGKIGKYDCIITKSGVGKVNAARTTQIMIQTFGIEYIINIGAAGAINCLLTIGDVVIAKNVVQHDFDITAFGHSKGYISGIGREITCNQELVEKFENVAKEIANIEEYNVKIGTVASGDIFCTEIAMKEKISSKFKADAVDMECAAIAQVCYLDEIPFVSIRCISDDPNEKNAKDYDENVNFVAKRCARILKEYCNKE